MRVFKYRSGDEQNFKRDLFAIEKNYFWGSNFNQLNDPCETLISSDKFKSLTKTFVELINKKAQPELEKVHIALDNVLARRTDIGIYSLSETYNDELLWAHYANSHQGFCIEYDLNLLLESYPTDKVYSFSIEYSKNPPEIEISDLSDKGGNSIIKKLAGNKSKRWEYEKEHRIITDKSGKHPYNIGAVKAIYFGLRMTEARKVEMMNTLKGRGIMYYQLYQVEGKYQFERKNIEDINGNEITYLCQIPQSNTRKAAIKFTITEKDFNKFIGKATAIIELESKLDRDELIWIAHKIKSDIFWQAERIFISYILKGMVADNGNWALTNFEGDELEVSINGLTLEQEILLHDGLKKESRKTLGMWIDESPFVCCSLVLVNVNNEVTLETNYIDGSKSHERLRYTQLDLGMRYDNIEGNKHGEYFIVAKDGTLRFYSEEGQFKELKPFARGN